ncbi:hypothetical protein JTB14_032610 [Gonioctena quinquepunctata]|nr:hypothetical protein JTB14_032610 [Gonioctena quinquepunctata]
MRRGSKIKSPRMPYVPYQRKQGKTIPRIPHMPPRTKEAQNNRNVENTPLDELLPALDELKDLLRRRPILANVVLLKNCQRMAEHSENGD